MAVDNDVDLFFVNNAQVSVGFPDFRRAKDDILNLGGNQGAAPAIANCGSDALSDQ